jgi:hypothetical protein
MLTKISSARFPRCVKAFAALLQSGAPLPPQAPLAIRANVNQAKKREGIKLTTLK